MDLCNGGTTVGRFVPIGTTEVCDRTTGLTWRKTQDAAATAKTYAEAVTWCQTPTATVATGSRLPEVNELLSLVDYSLSPPALLVGVFTGVATRVASDYYWSASSNTSGQAKAWIVAFGNVSMITDAKTATHHVWCIRGPM